MTESPPLKIAVVGVPGGWSSEALCDAIESRTGFRLLVDMDRVWFDSERGVVRYEDINLCDLDGLALKKAGKSYGTLLLDRLEFLRYVERSGVPCFSSPARILRHLNRLSVTLALRGADIPVPATVVSQDPREIVAAIRRFGAGVLKPIYSTKARGMRLLKADDPALEAEVQAFCNKHPLVYAQKHVTLPGRDLGVVFLGGEHLGTYARVAAEGSWNTTIRAGGHYAPADPGPEVIELARRAQAIFGLDFASVDVAETPEGPVVFEVTAFGGFRGLHEATGLVAAEHYADYVVARVLARQRGQGSDLAKI
ncbi:MAG: GAK system ATP-grasp enzyme [Planctomycetes bacterium]|nr:GAK system ATP-grasp enzyme [Planctomycetota bacterium]